MLGADIMNHIPSIFSTILLKVSPVMTTYPVIAEEEGGNRLTTESCKCCVYYKLCTKERKEKLSKGEKPVPRSTKRSCHHLLQRGIKHLVAT